ncbi:MAG: hypothetical protein AAFN13_11675 [Bacteroidota bacterium]
MSKPQRKFPIDFFDTLGQDPFMVADPVAGAAVAPLTQTGRVTRDRVPAFPEDGDGGGRSTYEPSPERRGSTRSVFFADDRPTAPPQERTAPRAEAPSAAVTQQVILIARSGSQTEGMDQLNAALADGWRVAHVAPTSASGPHFSALVFLERG